MDTLETELEAHAAYEATTVVTAEGETIAVLREAFDAVCNAKHWKDPWAAYVHHALVGRVLRAVEFFHGDRASVGPVQSLTGKVYMNGHGYMA